MNSDKPGRKQIPSLCAEPDAYDGLDPRFDFRQESRPVVRRKLLQLCREVERTLSAVLAGECADDVLRDLMILSVTPAPNAARLLVSVTLPKTANVSEEQALAHLGRAASKLRAEVAAAVRRRKAPELTFAIQRS